jgi:hypothetical protein
VFEKVDTFWTYQVGRWNPKDLIERFQPEGADPLPEFAARERLDEMGIGEFFP